jgi:hypothetical protein
MVSGSYEISERSTELYDSLICLSEKMLYWKGNVLTYVRFNFAK